MKDSLFDLKDRIVIITGGLGQIGLEFIKELLQREALVASFSRTIKQEVIAESIPAEAVKK